jgi:drug/metabolite transporter (DMT)-like permease
MTTPSNPARGFTGLDLLLVLLVMVWGVNYSVLKRVFDEVPPMAFNAMRFSLASAALVGGIAVARRRARRRGSGDSLFYTSAQLTRRDRLDLLWLGLVGHCAYQLCWSTGLPLTSVASSALIMATTPALVATGSAIVGHERLRPLHWTGLAVSLLGVVLVVGEGASTEHGSLRGDVLMGGAAICWAIFTLGGRRLIARHSPLYVSGTTTAIGTLTYSLLAVPSIARVEWPEVSTFVWWAVAYSGLLSVAAAYLIWYSAIQRIGPARTAIYANVVPIAAMGVAAIWLGERLTPGRIGGAAAVLTGVVLTRLARPQAVVPVEE